MLWGTKQIGDYQHHVISQPDSDANKDRCTMGPNEVQEPGQANMSMSTTQLAERFGCLSMTLEMPFKDNFDLPDPEHGWNPERSKYLAHHCLDALHAILPELKKA